MWFQKVSIPTPRKVIGNSRGAKRGGDSSNNKKLPWGWEGGWVSNSTTLSECTFP